MPAVIFYLKIICYSRILNVTELEWQTDDVVIGWFNDKMSKRSSWKTTKPMNKPVVGAGVFGHKQNSCVIEDIVDEIEEDSGSSEEDSLEDGRDDGMNTSIKLAIPASPSKSKLFPLPSTIQQRMREEFILQSTAQEESLNAQWQQCVNELNEQLQQTKLELVESNKLFETFRERSRLSNKSLVAEQQAMNELNSQLKQQLKVFY